MSYSDRLVEHFGDTKGSIVTDAACSSMTAVRPFSRSVRPIDTRLASSGIQPRVEAAGHVISDGDCGTLGVLSNPSTTHHFSLVLSPKSMWESFSEHADLIS